MENSIHLPIPDSIHPACSSPHPPRRRIRKPLVPLDAPHEGHSLQALVTGDDTQQFLDLCRQAARFPEDPRALFPHLSAIIASQSWEFHRGARMRAAITNLQISDDFDADSAEIENIDEPTRQGLAVRKLSADPAFRELGRDIDRAFHRFHLAVSAVLQTLHLVKGAR